LFSRPLFFFLVLLQLLAEPAVYLDYLLDALDVEQNNDGEVDGKVQTDRVANAPEHDHHI
jgi:hypothetical protein